MPALPKGLPQAGEFNPYYGKYLSLIDGDDFMALAENQLASSMKFLRAIPAAKADHRYGPDKWSVRQVVGHVADCERIFQYRSLAFARADKTSLPGFDENDYVAQANFEQVPLDNLISQYETTRRASLAFYGSLDAESWMRRGTANGDGITVRALAFIILGHERHHWGLLKERYGL